MRIHAIQTGTVAIRQRQREGVGIGPGRLLATLADRRWTEPLPILAWLIEHPEGLILVDTGETARTAERGYFTAWNPYLHTDHAGGIGHLPRSEFVVAARELHDAGGFRGKVNGYLPQHRPAWFSPTAVTFAARPFGPFAESSALTQAGDVVLVPTPGHTPGHLSVAVETTDALVLLAGDASYTQELMLAGRADGVTRNAPQARGTLAALRELTRQRPTVYLPSHEPGSATRLARMEPAPAT